MKCNKSLEWLINPFTRLAGWHALTLGVILSVIMTIIGYYSGVAFDGVLDIHFLKLSVIESLSMTGLSLISLIIIFWITGIIIAKPFRFIDLAGTLTLTKTPYIFLALIGFMVTPPDPIDIISKPEIIFQNYGLVIALILSIPITIWSVILMFNAYKISCGLKGKVLAVSFTIALIIAEGVSKTLIFFIM